MPRPLAAITGYPAALSIVYGAQTIEPLDKRRRHI